jgi:hypothetical protein
VPIQKPDTVPDTSEINQAARLIDDFVKELDALPRELIHGFDVKSFRSIQRILALPGNQHAAVVTEAIARQTEQMRQIGRERLTTNVVFAWNRYQGLKELIIAAAPASTLTTDESWTRFLRGQLDGLERASRTTWDALLLHCSTASQSKPARKWLQQADALIREIGPAAFGVVLSGTLAEIGQPGTPHIRQIYDLESRLDPTLIHDMHSDL